MSRVEKPHGDRQKCPPLYCWIACLSSERPHNVNMVPYAPSLIANAFLWKKGTAGMSHMKLQKLVFFFHAWSLALRGTPGVIEKPAPWQYGPVFSTLYHHLKQFGSADVTSYLQDFNPATGQLTAMVPNEIDTAAWSLLEQVWDRYGHLSALQLSALTHEKGGPWEQAFLAKMPSIPDEMLIDYYRSKMSQAQG